MRCDATTMQLCGTIVERLVVQRAGAAAAPAGGHRGSVGTRFIARIRPGDIHARTTHNANLRAASSPGPVDFVQWNIDAEEWS
jgi:hypothetical protein